MMTSEQKVKRWHPDAHLVETQVTDNGTYYVVRTKRGGELHGPCLSPTDAWRRAWSTVREERRKMGRENRLAAKTWSV